MGQVVIFSGCELLLDLKAFTMGREEHIESVVAYSNVAYSFLCPRQPLYGSTEISCFESITAKFSWTRRRQNVNVLHDLGQTNRWTGDFFSSMHFMKVSVSNS